MTAKSFVLNLLSELSLMVVLQLTWHGKPVYKQSPSRKKFLWMCSQFMRAVVCIRTSSIEVGLWVQVANVFSIQSSSGNQSNLENFPTDKSSPFQGKILVMKMIYNLTIHSAHEATFLGLFQRYDRVLFWKFMDGLVISSKLWRIRLSTWTALYLLYRISVVCH